MSYLGGHQGGWVCQLVVAVHPEGEEGDGRDAHDGHQRIQQRGEEGGLLRHRGDLGGCTEDRERGEVKRR